MNAETDERGAGEADVRPLVAPRSRTGPAPWAFAVALAGLALLLFLLLDGRRRALTAPAVRPRNVDLTANPVAPPTLFIPPVVERAPAPAPALVVAPPPPPAPAPAPLPAPPPRIVYVPQPAPMQPNPVVTAPSPNRASTTSPLVYDATSEAAAAAGPAVNSGGSFSRDGLGSAATAQAARAGVLRNRATTVAQGALIPAVLETAFDSTRPGLARALVTRDVRGFDGARVLIPRGSRLTGEYRADLQPGQNRALILWTRLVRPDGVTIAIGSPSGDPLGRVGVKGEVDSHFFQRFGAAILQSALDVGVTLAGRAGGGDSVSVIGLPGAVRSTPSPFGNAGQIQPTLRVRQGTPVTVFVARDLDFTGVERAR